MFGLVSDSSPLQSVLISATSGTGAVMPPHHPIVCDGEELGYGEDGSFWCPHVKVGPEDPRTYAALVHSMACLIMEEAGRL